MAAKLEVYKCEKCGNIVEVLHGGAGELVNCPTQHVPIRGANAEREAMDSCSAPYTANAIPRRMAALRNSLAYVMYTSQRTARAARSTDSDLRHRGCRL